MDERSTTSAARRHRDVGVPGSTDVTSDADRTGLWFGVSPGLVLRVGLPVSLVLALVSVTGRAFWYDTASGPLAVLVDVMDVDHEGSVPAWISSMVLLACAASLWTVGAAVRAGHGRWAWHWRLLAVVFAYLSLDELVSLHEHAIGPVRRALDLDGAFYYAWVVVALPLVVLLAAVMLPFLRALPRWTALAFAVSGAVYVGGAMGLEMVGGVIASRGGGGTLGLHAVVTVEELCEMVGMTLFLAAVNEHRRRHLGPLAPAST